MVKNEAARLDAVFGALAHPTRRAMVGRLRDGEATVGELAAPFDVSLAAVSRHLSVLRSAGLITQRRVGRRQQCRLNAREMAPASTWLLDFESFWRGRLDGLGALFDGSVE
jgi:DNA-binding transcriptional ArsR family regulator